MKAAVPATFETSQRSMNGVALPPASSRHKHIATIITESGATDVAITLIYD